MIRKITCYGETLWDIFPNKKVIGGAPLNVALRLNSLGNEVRMVSKIGQDHEGLAILDYLKKKKLALEGIQIDPDLPTGNVQVHLDNDHSATYTISEPVAWDQIEIKQLDIEYIQNSDAFVYGSLSCRSRISHNTLQEYLKHANFKIFDVNLRAPHYTLSRIKSLIEAADLIKLNDEELIQLSNFLEVGHQSLDQQITDLAKLFKIDTICVTLGSKGAILYTNDTIYRNPGYPVEVKDTVGAGDSFLASLTHQILSGSKPQDSLNFACATGALVASNYGANPAISGTEISNFIKLRINKIQK